MATEVNAFSWASVPSPKYDFNLNIVDRAPARSARGVRKRVTVGTAGCVIVVVDRELVFKCQNRAHASWYVLLVT